jgi:alanyl-tRNA synthetase
MDANHLRRAFTDFFIERGHHPVPSAGVIPHHPLAPLFVNAGMNQFIPYFVGEEPPPWPRATSVQKTIRLSGKHNDLDEVGKTRRHCTFFEMLGNFSFGDYFKEGAIQMAWELLTEGLGFDGDKLWITVHESDDEAEAIWHETAGVPMDRIQRLGDKDNWWDMGGPGPCGPNSEIHLDCGPEWGDPGGPAHGGGDRYVEFWNLVFMQYFGHPDGSRTELPKKNVDTGAGMERILMLLDNVPTIFDTDAVRSVVATAESLIGKRYGEDDATDYALRMLADHGRSMTILINDGVFPSNEDRGYVLRHLIRRAVRQAYLVGVEKTITPALVASVAESLEEAYPELKVNQDFISGVCEREEERFRHTLKSGLTMLESQMAEGGISGSVAFQLHDTFGFPIELTKEIAAERGAEVDLDGFEAEMNEQRSRARAARKAADGGGDDNANAEAYRELLEEWGTTEFTGYREYTSTGRVISVLPAPDGRVEIFLDRTPFYAEGGGQIGDTGTITTPTGAAEVVDTTYGLPGLNRHLAVVVEGEIAPGQEATAAVDQERRDNIRRNHTGTHLLHWALREVLGPHVRQHGSLVSPDYLRFDFSHYGPVSEDEMLKIEQLANERILANEHVRAYETSKSEAEQLGAIAFFGDKYGDVVRVVEAGQRSMELCGGTHVDALGMIGPIKVTSEASIGANLRRIFATTGAATLERFNEEEDRIRRVATLVRSNPDEVATAVEKLVDERRALEAELKTLRAEQARGEGTQLAASAVNGRVVARRDGLTQDQLRELAVSIRDQPGIEAVVLGGSPDGERVSLVAAVSKDSGLVASDLIAEAARTVGGGGSKKPDLAMAGGKDPSRLDEALDQVRAQLGL